jgi:N-acetylmuramoyl-L-alanine amidase
VFYLSLRASDNEARIIAAIENSAIRFEEKRDKKLTDLEAILGDMAQTAYINQSIELAGLIQKEAETRLNLPNRGLKSAMFYVLRNVMMPAVLIEGGFLTNPKDEEKLGDESFLAEIVEVITAAVVKYKNLYETNRLTATASNY